MSSLFLQPRSDYLKLNLDQFTVTLVKIAIEVECHDNTNFFFIELTFRNDSTSCFEADFVFPLHHEYMITDFTTRGERENLSMTISKGAHKEKMEQEPSYDTEKVIKIPVGAIEPGKEIVTRTQFLYSPKLRHGEFCVHLPDNIRSKLEKLSGELNVMKHSIASMEGEEVICEVPTKIHLFSSSAVSFIEERGNRDSVERCGTNSLSLELSILPGVYDFYLKWRNNSIATSYACVQKHNTTHELAAIVNFKPNADLAKLRFSPGTYVLVLKQPDYPQDPEWTIQLALADKFLSNLPRGSTFRIYVYGEGTVMSMSQTFLPSSPTKIDEAREYLEGIVAEEEFIVTLADDLKVVLGDVLDNPNPTNIFLTTTSATNFSAKLKNVLEATWSINWCIYYVLDGALTHLDDDFKHFMHQLEEEEEFSFSIISATEGSRKVLDDFAKYNRKTIEGFTVTFFDQTGAEIQQLNPPSSQRQFVDLDCEIITYIGFLLSRNHNQEVSKAVVEGVLRIGLKNVDVKEEIEIRSSPGTSLHKFVGAQLINELEFLLDCSNSKLEKLRKQTVQTLISKYSQRYDLPSQYTIFNTITLKKVSQRRVVREAEYVSTLEERPKEFSIPAQFKRKNLTQEGLSYSPKRFTKLHRSNLSNDFNLNVDTVTPSTEHSTPRLFDTVFTPRKAKKTPNHRRSIEVNFGDFTSATGKASGSPRRQALLSPTNGQKLPKLVLHPVHDPKGPSPDVRLSKEYEYLVGLSTKTIGAVPNSRIEEDPFNYMQHSESTKTLRGKQSASSERKEPKTTAVTISQVSRKQQTATPRKRVSPKATMKMSQEGGSPTVITPSTFSASMSSRRSLYKKSSAEAAATIALMASSGTPISMKSRTPNGSSNTLSTFSMLSKGQQRPSPDEREASGTKVSIFDTIKNRASGNGTTKDKSRRNSNRMSAREFQIRTQSKRSSVDMGVRMPRVSSQGDLSDFSAAGVASMMSTLSPHNHRSLARLSVRQKQIPRKGISPSASYASSSSSGVGAFMTAGTGASNTSMNTSGPVRKRLSKRPDLHTKSVKTLNFISTGVPAFNGSPTVDNLTEEDDVHREVLKTVLRQSQEGSWSSDDLAKFICSFDLPVALAEVPLNLCEKFGLKIAHKLHATMTINGYFETYLPQYDLSWRKAAHKANQFLTVYIRTENMGPSSKDVPLRKLTPLGTQPAIGIE